jgi:LacI family transcriptional regulator
MPVRLKDIAAELGLSVVTVSKVLRNHPDIGEKTRDRVLKRMKELKYQPNLTARSLSTGRTSSVGLVVPDLLHPFFARIAATLSAEVRKQHYGLIISSSEEDSELEREEIEQLLARHVDVLLIASSQWVIESFRRIEDQKVPYVLLDRRFAGLDANFVGVDDEAVGMLATSHLIKQGCQWIAHIRGPEVSTAAGRLAGYKQALAAHRRVPLRGHIVSIGTSGDHQAERGGYETAKKLLANKVRPDGVFCYNDPIALGAMRAILDSGLRIPEDVAIVGCGNLSYSDFLRVPLTSIDQNSQLIGERAAALALSLAQNKKITRTISEIISPQLVVRASSLRTPRPPA